MQVIGDVGIGWCGRRSLAADRRHQRLRLDVIQQSGVKRGYDLRVSTLQVFRTQEINTSVRINHSWADHPGLVQRRQNAAEVLRGWAWRGCRVRLFGGAQSLWSDAASEGDDPESAGDCPCRRPGNDLHDDAMLRCVGVASVSLPGIQCLKKIVEHAGGVSTGGNGTRQRETDVKDIVRCCCHSHWRTSWQAERQFSVSPKITSAAFSAIM